jgi:dolichyl-phosphate beta-glucosyltransferase
MSSAPPRERPALSIVLPVYNEELVLERTLSELVPFLDELAGVRGDFEVVCVDDGSRDASPEILKRVALKDARLRVLALPQNRGKGAAVRAGVLAARGAAVLFMDADLSTPLAEVPAFLEALSAGVDVAIGDRRARASEVRRRQPWLRQTLGKGFTLLTRLLLVPGVHDFTCGFKAFRGAAAEEIFRRSTLDGWAFDAELLVIAAVQKKRLLQLPVVWRHEDDSKVRLGAAVAGSLRDLGVIWWRRHWGRYR